MEQVAFKMMLKPGCKTEYQKRHDEIWPGLVALLKENGIKSYDIFLDNETGTLIAVQQINGDVTGNISKNSLMLQWWDHMADLMETNPDKSPMVWGLEKVFSMV